MRAVIAPFLILIAGIAACNDSQPGTPTSPDLRAGGPPSGCSYSQIKKDVDAEWPNSAGADTKATNSNVSALVTTMQQNAADSNIATATGFQILDTLANQTAKKQAGTTPAAGSQLALDLLKCMDVPAATIPTVAGGGFVTALGPAGAFAVRGRGPSDSAPVVSHDGAWNIQPVFQTASTQYSWIEIEVPDSGGSAGSTKLNATVKQLFLAFGSPQDPTGFSSDETLNLPPSGSTYSTVYNWGTAPKEFFQTPTSPPGPGFLISQCAAGALAGSYQSGFIQHHTASSSPEVLGFADPVCDVPTDVSLAAPRSLAQRLWQIFRPEPAYAAVLGGGSGSKGSNLSPWGVIDPGVVNLTFNQTPSKNGNTVGLPLIDKNNQPFHVEALSKAGTPLGAIFTWIEAVNNQGTNVLVCKNWAYTDPNGVATFRNAYLNKAGGYILTFKTVGTKTTTGTNDLIVDAGTEPSSALFNVKNGTPNTDDCSGTNVFTFDPTKPADQQNLPPVPSGLSP